MTTSRSPTVALVRAEAQVAAVRDDPAARLALMARVFRGPTGHAPRHLPFGRAALSFMRWQARRGVLNCSTRRRPAACGGGQSTSGCCGTDVRRPSRSSAAWPASRRRKQGLWLEFAARPTARNWYRAHNASIVGAYLEHRGLAETESAGALLHERRAGARAVRALTGRGAATGAGAACSARPPPGRSAARNGGAFLSLGRVLPNRYPLDHHVERYIADEQRLGRMLDYAVIVPRLQRLYEWSAEELAEPCVLELVRDGNLIYAWSYEERHVWRPRRCRSQAVCWHVTRPIPRAAPTHAGRNRKP